MANGKSPIAGSGDPTRTNSVVVVAVNLNTIFSLFFTNRDRRLVDPERGTTNSPDPWTAELEEVSCLTTKLLGAPSPEGKPADTKHRPGRIPASTTSVWAVDAATRRPTPSASIRGGDGLRAA